MFTIPCVIGNTKIEHTMLDLGASINVMPHSMYASLKLGPLKQTGIIIQLADRSNVYPEGIIEDVLVKINNLIFPADFYILYMEDDASLNPNPILLGRPFLKTSKTKIDVDKGKLTMEFDGETIEFDVFKEKENKIENHSVSTINMINCFDMQDAFVMKKDEMKDMKRRSYPSDEEFKGKRYKQKLYLKESSYFPT